MKIVKVLLLLIVASTLKVSGQIDTTGKFVKDPNYKPYYSSNIPEAEKFAKKGLLDYDLLSFDEGIENFKKALTIDKNNPKLMSSIGYGYLKTGKLDSAESYLLMSLKIDSLFKIASKNLIAVYLRGNLEGKALVESLNYIKRFPDDAEGYYHAMLTYNKLYEYDKAIKHGLIAAEIYKKNKDYYLGDAYYALALGFFYKKDTENALVYFGKAKELGMHIPEKYLKLSDKNN